MIHAAAVSSSAQTLAVYRQELERDFSNLCNRTMGSSPSRTTLCVRKENLFVFNFFVRTLTAEGLLILRPFLFHSHPSGRDNFETYCKKNRCSGVSIGVFFMLTNVWFPLRYRPL